MVKVIGTRGKVVDFEIRGVGAVITKLRLKGIQIIDGIDFALIRSAAFIEGEIKESIAGERAEVRSVDTGRFINSINVGTKKKNSITVESDVSYARILEFGGAGRSPRSHFRNSLARNENKIRDQFRKDIKKVLSK